MKNYETDILVVGAGLTGLCLATVLSKFFNKITIIDKNQIYYNKITTNDMRTTAISEGSKKILMDFNHWDNIKNHAQPINKIKIFDRYQSNKIDFINPRKSENLGYIVENKFLKKAFIQKIITNKKINFVDKCNIRSLYSDNDYAYALFDNIQIKTNLIIAADGKFSKIRKKAKIPNYEKKYPHSAIVINLIHTKKHNNTAYEIFNKSGPLAILPMLNDEKKQFRSAVIWSCPKHFAHKFEKLDNKIAISILNENIEKYIGKVKNINDQKVFDLSAHVNKSFYSNRLVFVGDSAHSVHPIAGQGWNLGLRDIESLDEIFKENFDIIENDLTIDGRFRDDIWKRLKTNQSTLMDGWDKYFWRKYNEL